MSDVQGGLSSLGLPERGSDDERRRAARYVAARASDAQDAAELLDMLGLDAREAL